MTIIVLNPILRDHCLELAERYLADTRPTSAPVTMRVRSGPRAWYVLQTKMRCEDDVKEALRELGFEAYAPMMRKEVFRRRKLVEREFRLFNRYLFVELPVDTAAWRTVQDIDGYDAVLGAGGVPCPIPSSDIARFRAAEAARQFDVTKHKRFPIGSRVRALAGPFGGFSGLVESLPGKGVVKAMIEIFGQMVPVHFSYDMVERE